MIYNLNYNKCLGFSCCNFLYKIAKIRIIIPMPAIKEYSKLNISRIVSSLMVKILFKNLKI